LKGPILIVDDDPDDQALIVASLQHLGNKQERIIFSDGSEALDYLRVTTDNPFIIFCDVRMPRMDGIELKQQIEKDAFLRKKSIPFIYITGSAVSADVIEAYKLSVQGFFVKPDLLEGWQSLIGMILKYWGQSVHPKSLLRAGL
jgi:CheY-like chemotaxis protein